MKKVFLCGLCLFFGNIFSLRERIDIHSNGEKIEITDCLKNVPYNLEKGSNIILDNAIRINRNASDQTLEIVLVSDDPLEQFVVSSRFPLVFSNISARNVEVNGNNFTGLFFTGRNYIDNLEIDTYSFVNQGYLKSKNMQLQCQDGSFRNERHAKLKVNNLAIPSCALTVNDGVMKTRTFLSVGDFSQNGLLQVFDHFNLNGHLHFNGRTEIMEMNMPPLNSQRDIIGGGVLSIAEGNFQATSFIVGRGANVNIGALIGTIKTFGNYGQLQVDRLFVGGKLYSGPDSIAHIKEMNSPTSIISNGSQLLVEQASEIPMLSTSHGSKAAVQGAAIDQMISSEDSRNFIKSSRVKNIHTLGESDTLIADSNVDSIRNNGTMHFQGDNFVQKMSNASHTDCADGETTIDKYTSENATLVVKDTEGKGYIQSENSPYMFQGKGGSLYINSMSGRGRLEAPKLTFNNGFVRGFALKGNANIYLDYMPSSYELPEYEGQLNLRVDLPHNFTNTKNLIFGDTVFFFFDMHGCNWENAAVDFKAGGLQIVNANTVKNHDGRMMLYDFIRIKAQQIINSATPEERENGRWEEDNGCWRAPHLKFYMPAKYRSQRKNTGMVSGNEMSLEAKNSIENIFSTMATAGEMSHKAGKRVENTVGTMYAQRESTIDAPEIVNRDLGETIRQGGAFASGRCGWGFGRHTWYYSVHKAEIINASESARMIFGDNVSFNTNHLVVQGSSILSGQQINISPNAIQDFRSVVDNTFECAGNIDLTSPRICGIGVQFFSVGDE